MSLPYYRFFTGDYDRNTRHLSMLQHGAYRLLIDAYMANGPLPNDLERLHRICGAFNAEERMAIEVVLTEFFVLQGPTWFHKRCEREREWQREKSRSAKESIGIRWNNERIYERNTIQNQNHIRSKSKASMSDSISSNRDIARHVLDYLNEKTGKRYRYAEANLKLISSRIKEGATLEDLKAVVDLKLKHWKYDPEMADYLRPATLFNATKCNQYLGEIDASNEDVR